MKTRIFNFDVPNAATSLVSCGRDEEGATAIEYGLIAGLVAVVIIAAVSLLGTDIQAVFTSITNALPGGTTTTTTTA